MDYEIGHVNLAVNSEEEKARALAAVKEKIESGLRGRMKALSLTGIPTATRSFA